MLYKNVHSSAPKKLCELMVAARKRAGLNQMEVAIKLRKPQSFVAKYRPNRTGRKNSARINPTNRRQS